MSQERSRPSTTTLGCRPRSPPGRRGTCSASQRPVGWRTSVARGLLPRMVIGRGLLRSCVRRDAARTGLERLSRGDRSQAEAALGLGTEHQATSVICDPSLSRVMGSTSRSKGCRWRNKTRWSAVCPAGRSAQRPGSGRTAGTSCVCGPWGGVVTVFRIDARRSPRGGARAGQGGHRLLGGGDDGCGGIVVGRRSASTLTP